MKPFSIKFDGTKARIVSNIEVAGEWHKKTLTADSAEELWEGMQRLLHLDSLPAEDKKLAVEYISKVRERENIELALPIWLGKGNKIKVFAPVGIKAILSEAEKNDILLDLGLFDDTTPERGTEPSEALDSIIQAEAS